MPVQLAKAFGRAMLAAMTIIRCIFTGIVLILSAIPAMSAPIRCGDDGDGGGACVWGRVEGYDAGSVQIRGLRLHLMGIVPPQPRDFCAAKGAEFDCARWARKRMGELLAKGVACDIWDVAGGNLLGRCRVADGDLGRLLVASGVARAAKDGPYDGDQAQAVSGKKGLWAADVTLPKDWDSIRRKGDKAD